jgi:hypothetical protein
MILKNKSDLIHVGELAVGFSENVLPDSGELAGSEVKLYFEDGSITHYTFRDAHSLSWQTERDEKVINENLESYRATCPRSDFYFVDYVSKETQASSISMVLDFSLGIATILQGTLPTEKTAREDKLARVSAGLHQTAVDAVFRHASIGQPFAVVTPKHGTTTEMIGKRVKYVYSSKDAYEHIYLNENLYTWHCLSGIEKGMSDTELCHYYKIADQLFLFVWREKLVPTLGVIVLNLETMKTTGKIFGYDGEDFSRLCNFPIGAFAKLLNVTEY